MTVQLPNSQKIVTEFGGCSNQHGTMPMGRTSFLYDVLNDMTVAARIARYDCGERELALKHFDTVLAFDARSEGHRSHENDLFLFDMGYPALCLIAIYSLKGKAFVIRCSHSFLKAVQDAVHSGQRDVIVARPLKKLAQKPVKEVQKRVPEVALDMTLSLRVITLYLEDGHQEILLTSLLDNERVPYEDFQPLYAKRWGNESSNDVYKNILEVENFTGLSALSVRPDFYATVFTTNIRGLLHWDLQDARVGSR